MRLVKKMLSAFLVACMVISMLPMVAVATETGSGASPSGRIILDQSTFSGYATVWIDGIEYAVQNSGGSYYVDLPTDLEPGSMVTYSYHIGDAADIHTQYPIGMQVWELNKNADGSYTPEKVEELNNILQYSGSSIRITGNKGIRMITSIERNKKNDLTSGGLAGYKLLEYGTVLAWSSNLAGGNPLVLGRDYAKSNYAYKKGVADPVFAYTDNLMQYTNVLVGFTLDECKDDIAMRPYMILEDENGEQMTIYGGIVHRSIGYIAWQNRDVFTPGSAAYNYVWEIIRHVYAEITFNTNGGSAVESAFVEKGDILVKPADPTREGFSFGGWYTDAGLTYAYDFATPVTADMTLYAKWEANNEDESSRTLPEDIKDALGLAKDTDDSDSDGLTDYEELMIVGTDPLKYDTDNDGVSDAEDDEDNDGLGNLEEVRLGTLPTEADSDFDGLNDYDEINTYGTNPVVADSDGDGLTDGEEIDLGLNPMNPKTDGSTPDAERTFEQTASNDAIMDLALRNSDNWLTPSIEGNVPGNIDNNILLEKSSTSAFNDNRAVLSDIIELSTNYESESLTLSFTYNESYTGSIENLTIASFGEDGLEIVDTTINESEQTLTGEITGSGTYFVIDLDEFLKGLGIDVLGNLYTDHDMSVMSLRGEPQKVYAENTSAVDSEEDELPAEETEAAEATEAIEATEATEANEVTEPTEATESTEATEDADSTEAAAVIEDAETTEATEATEVTESTEATEATEDVEAAEAAAVIEDAETTEATEATEVTEAPEVTESTEATEAAEDVEAAEAAAVIEDAEATEVTEAVTQDEQPVAMMFSRAAVAPAATHSATGKADVVFVIDTTGSMSSAISGVKNNINTFASKLVSDYNIDVNFALIDYRDITVDGTDSTVLHKNLSSNWYTSVSSFTNAINSLGVDGGGDTPETPIDALEIARKLDWRGDSVKFVILVTDANYKNNNISGIADMNEMSRKLVDSGIITSAISCYEDDYDELTTPSGGLFGYIYGDFSNILLQLAEMVGEETNADGEWVFLDDFQAVKLSDTLDNASTNDTDGDDLKDAQELGTSRVVDMLPYITSLMNRYDVPVESYTGKTQITVWKYRSNPVRIDTDYDGTKDKEDSNPRKWDISDRDLAISAGISYTNLVKGAKIDTYSSISLGSGANVNEMVGWTVLDTWHGGAGFYAAALKKDKNIVLAFRGSKPGYDGIIDIDWIDDWVYADFINVMTGISTQAPAAQAFTEKIIKNYPGYDIYICGHSLGGNLAYNASIKALKTKPSVVERVSTFNGLGMPNMRIYGELFTKDFTTLFTYENRFYDYEIEGDPVSAFEFAPDHKWYEIFDVAVTTGVGHRIVKPLKVSGNAHGLENFYLQMEPLGRPIS